MATLRKLTGIMGFDGNKTMIITAHRLSTMEHYDISFIIVAKKLYRSPISLDTTPPAYLYTASTNPSP